MAVILIIDDDEAMRRLMVRTLGDAHTLIEAQNGQDGLALLRERHPDIVITDILMPQKEGIETIREIRQVAPATKIIAVSGGGASHNLMFLDIAKAFGADVALAKPFRPAQLVKIVERTLDKGPGEAQE